jgi:hypothetical protein
MEDKPMHELEWYQIARIRDLIWRGFSIAQIWSRSDVRDEYELRQVRAIARHYLVRER